MHLSVDCLSIHQNSVCFLLHNRNVLGSIPVAHSVHAKESYGEVKTMLSLLDYDQHRWVICVDLKMVIFLLGQQAGYTKYPCFFYYWNIRVRHKNWVQKDWRSTEHLLVREQNIENEALASCDKIIFPPLHIKRGLIKKFVKALNKEGQCFRYLRSSFAGLSVEKLKSGIFDGPQIRKIINDEDFIDSTLEEEKDTWTAFVDVLCNFLGNRKAENYEDMVRKFLRSYHQLGCNMSIKIHFFFNHLEQFPDNLGDYSDE